MIGNPILWWQPGCLRRAGSTIDPQYLIYEIPDPTFGVEDSFGVKCQPQPTRWHAWTWRREAPTIFMVTFGRISSKVLIQCLLINLTMQGQWIGTRFLMKCQDFPYFFFLQINFIIWKGFCASCKNCYWWCSSSSRIFHF